MNKKAIDKAIRDYLSGKPSEEGEALFNRWYASFDDTQDALPALSPAEKAQLGRDIFRKIEAKKNTPLKRTRKRWPAPWYQVAAVLTGLLITVSAYLIYQQWTNAATRYTTEYGEIKNIVLPDGSTVVLNANSSLRYAPDWQAHTDRCVWLEGEAYFSVMHTPDNQRFLVQTDDVTVEVLGTEFNVSQRREDIQVVLSSGQVKLSIPHQRDTTKVLMQPGDLVSYSSGNQKITQQTVSPERHTAWKDQKLWLDNTSLAEIALFLEDYYGLQVTVSDSLKDLRLSATTEFTTKDEAVILNAIAEIYGIEVQREGQHLTLRKK